MTYEARVPITCDADIVIARQRGRALAAELGVSNTDQALIATAISELARNIVAYAKRGEIVIAGVSRAGRPGIMITARDAGPGIPNIELAMQDGYSTGGGLGLGLSGTRRLMAEFEIASEVGKGTTVITKKWTHRHE